MLNNPIILGAKLPALSNPGTAGDLLAGKQLIDQNGNMLTGVRPAKYCTFVSVFFGTEGGNYLMAYQNERSVTVSLSANPSGLTTFAVLYGDGAVYLEEVNHPVAGLSVGISGSDFARTVTIIPRAVGNVDLHLYAVGRNGYGNSDTFTYHITVSA